MWNVTNLRSQVDRFPVNSTSSFDMLSNVSQLTKRPKHFDNSRHMYRCRNFLATVKVPVIFGQLLNLAGFVVSSDIVTSSTSSSLV